MIIFEILKYISITLLLIKTYYYTLNIYQQEHYDNKKLLKHLIVYYQKPYIILSYFIIISTTIKYWYIQLIIILFSIISLYFKDNFVIKLKITKRIIRLLLTNILLLTIITTISFIYIKHITLFIYSLYILLVPYFIIITNTLNKPIEKIINKYYIKLAEKKLNQNKILIKIAITGSYGKTTTKNIINNILSEHFYTLATPKSYNTMQGITKTINQYLNNNTEIFICEMGAFREKEIKEMTKFIKPHIVVITDIGEQHLETFKTINNIIKAKFEIINYSTAIPILNFDNQYIKNEPIQKDKIYTIGINNTNTSIYASDIIVKNINNYITTTFNINNLDNKIPIDTMLLGHHNIYNILISYGVIQALEQYNIHISDEQFSEAIYNTQPIPHRLSLNKEHNIYIFDDSYNSNIKGFTNAINTINQMNTYKIIITPGLVDLKNKQKEYNETIANKLNIFDEIYLINNQSSKYIYNQLLKTNQTSIIHLFDSFKEAYQNILSKHLNQNYEVSILIENDLPDNFLERNKNVK